MSSALQKLSVPGKRVTYSDQLKTWESGQDQDRLYNEIEAIQTTFQKSFGHRWTSRSTQDQQDRVLDEYRTTVALTLKARGVRGVIIEPDREPEVNDAIIFPKDEERMIEYACDWLIMTARNMAPRSVIDERPRLSTLIKRRTNLLHWLTSGRKLVFKLDLASFYLRTNECLQYIADIIGFNETKKSKTYLGREEVLQLIEYDISVTPNISIAEQHAVAWLFGVICGVRNGTLAENADKPGKYLRWEDIDITRELSDVGGEWSGNFTVVVKFKYLKGKKEKRVEKVLPMTIKSPKLEKNLPLSLPHRLLVILLRRGYLEDHTTVESLLNGRQYQIRIKKDALHKPVFLAARSRENLSEDRARARALTDYMKVRTQWLGYPLDCTFYCWRRRAGTLAERAGGLDRARRFMDHGPGSHTFEDYYDEGLNDFDIVDIMLDGGDGSDAQGVLQNVGMVALHRHNLVKRSVDREIIIRTFVNQHPEVVAALAEGIPNTIRSTKKRIRRSALIAILTEEKDLQTASRSHAELTERLAEMKKPSKIMQMIVQRTSEPQSAVGLDLHQIRQDDLIDIEDRLGIDFDGEDDTGREPEAVLITTDGDDINDDDDESPVEVPLKELATTFMDILLNYTPKKETITCPKCEADPWTTEESKTKFYKKQHVLNRHLASKFHSGRETFIRRMNAEKGDGDFKCSYGCDSTFSTLKHLMEHIRNSSNNIEKWGQDHEDEKTADGWYSDEWDPPVENAKAEKRPIAATGIKYDIHHVAHDPKKIKIHGESDIVYYGGDEMEMYAQADASSALYFGEEEDSIINDAMRLLFVDGEPSSDAI